MYKPGPLRTLLAVIVLAISAMVWAQQPAATLNWKDADIRQVVEAVSLVTGKHFILDPRVTGRVTLLSPTPAGPRCALRGLPVDSPGAWLRRR